MNAITINNFEDIPPDFDRNLLLFALKCFGPLSENIDFTDSNGQSIVLISKERDYIFQHYKNNNTFHSIISIMQTLKSNSFCNYILHHFTIHFNIFHYITGYYEKIIDNDPSAHVKNLNIIKWEKIEPINPIKRGAKTSNFLVVNINKLLFDIGQALYGLHHNNIFHRDCTVDNIGINSKQNFMLYDFDFSCKSSIFNRKQLIDEDYRMLLRSLKMYIEDKEIIGFLEDIISYKDQMLFRLATVLMEENKHDNMHITLEYLSKQKIRDTHC
jgi:serine/threonine protein kinase